MIKYLRLLFWIIRYRFYTRDLYLGLRAGRGTKENPLTMDDMVPVMKALGRLSATYSDDDPLDAANWTT